MMPFVTSSIYWPYPKDVFPVCETELAAIVHTAAAIALKHCYVILLVQAMRCHICVRIIRYMI